MISYDLLVSIEFKYKAIFKLRFNAFNKLLTIIIRESIRKSVYFVHFGFGYGLSERQEVVWQYLVFNYK